jgi:hypothetical protein
MSLELKWRVKRKAAGERVHRSIIANPLSVDPLNLDPVNVDYLNQA